MQRSSAGRALLEASQASFAHNRYYLEIEKAVFAYDFDTQEWSVFGDASALRQFI